MEAVCTSEMSVYFNETTRHYIQESCHLQMASVFLYFFLYVAVWFVVFIPLYMLESYSNDFKRKTLFSAHTAYPWQRQKFLKLVFTRIVSITGMFFFTYTEKLTESLRYEKSFGVFKKWQCCSELSSGIYCRVKWLSTNVSEVRSSLMMEAVRTSETSVDNHFTRQYIPEDNSEHHTRCRENLKSHNGNA
jgi:hypothetical protein